MTEAGLEEVTAAVRADRAFLRLLNALALGEGFQFNILVCETPRLAQAAVRALAGELSALRGDPWLSSSSIRTRESRDWTSRSRSSG